MLQVMNSPFNQDQAELLNRLLPTLTESQRVWLSGYLTAPAHSAAGAQAAAASLEAAAAPASAAPNEPAVPREATVIYGSQTGNSHKLAKKLSDKLQEQGFQTTLSSMGDFKTNTLKKARHLFIVVSTHGEGDPPDNAISFHEFLLGKRAPQLDGLRFSVLALGDTSYEFFCQTGKDFDQRLEELGAQRLVPRVDCDVDYEEAAADWMRQVLGSLNETTAKASVSVSALASPAAVTAEAALSSEYSRSHPFQAAILENLNLNGRGSQRETRHLELSLEGSNLHYEPGDSLGVYPENHPHLVRELIEEMGWKPDEPVAVDKNGKQRPLLEALTSTYEISQLTKPLLEQISKLVSDPKLRQLTAAGQETELRNYIRERDLLDLARDCGLRGLAAQTLAPLLRKLPPRLYSIASSPKAYPDEVHLTVRKVQYEAHGRARYGVCSTHLAERAHPGGTLPVFVQSNPNFKLPADPDTPIVMIGPGTGVAPFRSFLGEREESGAQGRAWLFYGDQHFSTDFLYQLDWQRWLKDGILTHMDVAFSRDTDRKVYVQHRMLEKSKELYRWLQDGAVVYVCGDEKQMARDVHAALAAILSQEGGLGPEEAAEYLSNMQRDKRYQRDVY